jgi:hypothetical protein
MSNPEQSDLERWIESAIARGFTRGYVEVLLDREHANPMFCVACGRPIIDGEDVAGFMSVPCHDGNLLCEACNDGDAGHAEFHANVQRELDGMLVHSRNARETWQSHRIAEDEHAKCPWAERGKLCDIVDDIKHRRESAAECDTTNDDDAEQIV